jgi:hypothetical protein
VLVARSQQDGDAQQQEAGTLFLPHLNSLHEAYIVRGEDASNVAAIPAQNRLTHQILSMWQHFKDLKQTFAVFRPPCGTASLACAAVLCRYG